MKWPRLTVRARLTALYTGLFAIGGAVIVIIAYILVPGVPLRAGDPGAIDGQADFVVLCSQPFAQQSLETQFKCQKAYEEGLLAGAQNQRDATQAKLLQYSLLTFVVVTLLAGLMGWIVAGRSLRPLHQIAGAARKASQHNLSARVALTGPRDELRDLAETFDEMLARLESAFGSQRQFIANASHELRTPLTVMRTSVDVVLAKSAPSAGEFRAMAVEIRAAVDDADRLIDALLTLARNERGLTSRELVDLATIAENALDEADRGDRQVQPSLQPAAVSGDPVLLERLIANLLNNALRYNVSGGNVWLNTTVAGRWVTLTVANTGPVIPPDLASQLTEPFRRMSNRTTRDGFGLGLALVSSIASIHHGTATVHSRPGGGLAVEVILPLADVP